jgi:hypothetical protein
MRCVLVRLSPLFSLSVRSSLFSSTDYAFFLLLTFSSDTAPDNPQPAVLVRRHGTYSWGAGSSFLLFRPSITDRLTLPLLLLFLLLSPYHLFLPFLVQTGKRRRAKRNASTTSSRSRSRCVSPASRRRDSSRLLPDPNLVQNVVMRTSYFAFVLECKSRGQEKKKSRPLHPAFDSFVFFR